jgi:hypothetical protein
MTDVNILIVSIKQNNLLLGSSKPLKNLDPDPYSIGTDPWILIRKMLPIWILEYCLHAQKKRFKRPVPKVGSGSVILRMQEISINLKKNADPEHWFRFQKPDSRNP